MQKRQSVVECNNPLIVQCPVLCVPQKKLRDKKISRQGQEEMFPLTVTGAASLHLPCLNEGRCPHLGLIDPENPDIVVVTIVYGEGNIVQIKQHQVCCTRQSAGGEIINPCTECPGRELQAA